MTRRDLLNTTSSQGYSLAPKPSMLLGLANQKWTVAEAVSELADNSFGQGRGNARSFEVIFDAKKRTLVVFDNGQGMNHIGDLFRLGQTAGIFARDIGRYGMGGTLALIWLASKVRIWTMRDRKVMFDTILWSEIQQADNLGDVMINDTWERATIANTPEKLFEAGHGTLIEITLKRERIFQADYVQRELAKTYAPALRHGRTITWITLDRRGREHEQTLADTSMVLPDDPEFCIDFNMHLRTPEGVMLPVHGSVGLIEGLPYAKSKIAIGFGPRVIFSTRDCFQSQKEEMADILGVEYTPSEDEKAYSGVGIAGWLDLGDGWQEFLNTTKNGIADDRVRTVLMHHVYEKIKPLLEKTERDQQSVVFEGIAMELENALNNISDDTFQVESKVMVAKKRGRGYGGGTPPQPDPNNPIPEIMTTQQDQVQEEKIADKPAVSRIELIKATEEVLDGAMCRMQILSDEDRHFAIEINIDHAVVTALLIERPLNKVGLHLMLTREVAAALLKFDKVARRVLPEGVMVKLDNLSDPLQRERMLARILFDKAKRPVLVDEEEAA